MADSMANYTYGQGNLGLPGGDANGNHPALGVGHNDWPAQSLDGIQQLWQGDDNTLWKLGCVAGLQPSDPAGTTGTAGVDPYVGGDSGRGPSRLGGQSADGYVGSTDRY